MCPEPKYIYVHTTTIAALLSIYQFIDLDREKYEKISNRRTCNANSQKQTEKNIQFSFNFSFDFPHPTARHTAALAWASANNEHASLERSLIFSLCFSFSLLRTRSLSGFICFVRPSFSKLRTESNVIPAYIDSYIFHWQLHLNKIDKQCYLRLTRRVCAAYMWL